MNDAHADSDHKAEASWRAMQKLADELGQKAIAESGYVVEEITDPHDPALKSAHLFVAQHFPKEEVDTFDIMRDAVEESWGVYIIIKDPGGEVVAHACYCYLDLLRPGDSWSKIEPPEGVLYVGYVLIDPLHRGKKLANEMYRKAYEYAASEAQARKSLVRGVIGECVETVESFMNKMGQKRVYFEDKNGNVREVRFHFGPVEYDPESGEPATRPDLLHLMYRTIDDRQRIPVPEVLSIVKTIYSENYLMPATTSKKVRENNEELIDSLLETLSRELDQAKDGAVFFMTAAERAAKKIDLESQGKQLIDFVAK